MGPYTQITGSSVWIERVGYKRGLLSPDPDISSLFRTTAFTQVFPSNACTHTDMAPRPNPSSWRDTPKELLLPPIDQPDQWSSSAPAAEEDLEESIPTKTKARLRVRKLSLRSNRRDSVYDQHIDGVEERRHGFHASAHGKI